MRIKSCLTNYSLYIVTLSLIVVCNQVSAGPVLVTSGADSYFVADNGVVSGAGTAVTSAPVDTNTDHYSETGLGGQDVGQPDSWNGDRRWGNNGADTSATFTFDDLLNGTYNVYASWRNVEQGNVSVARYSVSDGGPTTDLDQRPGSASQSALLLNDGTNDIDFALIGAVSISDGNLSVTVDDSATGSADGNSFIHVDAIAVGPVIPEPSSLVLAVLGLLGITAISRRARKN